MLLETESISAETLLKILGIIAGIIAGAFGVIKVVATKKGKGNGTKSDTKQRLNTQEVDKIARVDTRWDDMEKAIAALTQIAKEIRAVVDATNPQTGSKLVYGNPLLQEAISKELQEITRLLQALVGILERK